jgi:hypothetical protein
MAHSQPARTTWADARPLDVAYFRRVYTETRGSMRKERYRSDKPALTLVNTESGIPLVTVQLFDQARGRAIKTHPESEGATVCKTAAHVDAWNRGVSLLKIVITNWCDQGFVLCNIFDADSTMRTTDGSFVPINDTNAFGPWSCTMPAYIGTGRAVTNLKIAVAPQVCTNRMQRLFAKTHWCSSDDFKINSINRDAEFAKVAAHMTNQTACPDPGPSPESGPGESIGPAGMTIEEITEDIEHFRITQAAAPALSTGVANMCTFDFASCAQLVDWRITLV